MLKPRCGVLLVTENIDSAEWTYRTESSIVGVSDVKETGRLNGRLDKASCCFFLLYIAYFIEDRWPSFEHGGV